MTAVNPSGNEKYWLDGLPFEGLLLQDVGTEKYWFDGLPGENICPMSAPIVTTPPITAKLVAMGLI